MHHILLTIMVLFLLFVGWHADNLVSAHKHNKLTLDDAIYKLQHSTGEDEDLLCERFQQLAKAKNDRAKFMWAVCLTTGVPGSTKIKKDIDQAKSIVHAIKDIPESVIEWHYHAVLKIELGNPLVLHMDHPSSLYLYLAARSMDAVKQMESKYDQQKVKDVTKALNNFIEQMEKEETRLANKEKNNKEKASL